MDTHYFTVKIVKFHDFYSEVSAKIVKFHDFCGEFSAKIVKFHDFYSEVSAKIVKFPDFYSEFLFAVKLVKIPNFFCVICTHCASRQKDMKGKQGSNNIIYTYLPSFSLPPSLLTLPPGTQEISHSRVGG
jgi:hypothetical protein